MSQRFCGQCGAELVAGSGFCSRCGTKAESVTAAAAAAPVDVASLLQRPGVVTLLVVLDFFFAVVFFLAAVGLGIGFAGDQQPALLIAAAVALLMAVILALAGRGMLRLDALGRTLQIVLAVLGLLAFPFGTLASIGILIYLTRPGVKVLFSGVTRPSPEQLKSLKELKGSSAAVVVIAAIVLSFLAVPFAAIISAIAIPNLLNAIQRGKQKRTMADLRSIGTGVEAFKVDHNALPSAEPGAASALAAELVPTYITHVPAQDAWQHEIVWTTDEEGYYLISYGKDGEEDDSYEPGATTDFDADIYYSNGEFLRYPEGTQN